MCENRMSQLDPELFLTRQLLQKLPTEGKGKCYLYPPKKAEGKLQLNLLKFFSKIF